MRMLAAALPLVLLACSAGTPPPADPPAVAVVPPPPETAAASPPPPTTTTTTATATATASATAAPAPGIPAACRGADVDIQRVAATKECDVHRSAEEAPPPKALAVELTAAKARVKPGETVDLTIALINKTAAPLDVDLDLSCGLEGRLLVEARDATGARADKLISGCGFGRGCGMRTLHVQLDAGGRAHATVPFETKVEKTDAKCAFQPAGAMKPGTYTVSVTAPVDEQGPGGRQRQRAAETRITVAP